MDKESEHSSLSDCGNRCPEKPTSELDEKDQGNTLPLCFEEFEIIRRGFQDVNKNHTSQFPGLSLSEILRNREDHDRSFEHPRTEVSAFESMIEESCLESDVTCYDVREWETVENEEEV